MSVFDVRDEQKVDIKSIQFAETEDDFGTSIAFLVQRWSGGDDLVIISDEDYDEDSYSAKGFVVVSSKEHAENLKKALDKAIELGWLV